MCDPTPKLISGTWKMVDSNPGIQSANQQVRQPVTVQVHGNTPPTPSPLCSCCPSGHEKTRIHPGPQVQSQKEKHTLVRCFCCARPYQRDRV